MGVGVYQGTKVAKGKGKVLGRQNGRYPVRLKCLMVWKLEKKKSKGGGRRRAVGRSAHGHI